MNTDSTIHLQEEEIQMTVEGDETAKYTPYYPEGLLPVNEKSDPPRYEGDMTDMNARIRFKLFQVWQTWSALRVNETLIKDLAYNEKDAPELMNMKTWLVLTIDRIGKILAENNIVEEMKMT